MANHSSRKFDCVYCEAPARPVDSPYAVKVASLKRGVRRGSIKPTAKKPYLEVEAEPSATAEEQPAHSIPLDEMASQTPCERRVSRSKARDPRLSRAFVQGDQEARKRAMQLGLKDRGSPFVRIMNTHDIACSPLESLHVFHLGILKVRHLLALFSSSRYSHASGSRRRGSPAPLSLV